jgi:hypothetical protein
MVDPFSFRGARGGNGHAGELAGRAALLVPLGDGLWELLDVACDSHDSEENTSAWRASAEARAAFDGWAIEWVPESETRAFAEKYFPGVDPAVAWRVIPE